MACIDSDLILLRSLALVFLLIQPAQVSQRLKPAGLELVCLAVRGHPVLFHDIHGEKIQLSPDKRRAKRVNGFGNGICFSNRPINIEERIYVQSAEVSTEWSGVIRFGFTANDPVTLNSAELPRYACPDLTTKPGYWANSIPDKYSELGTVLFFYYTSAGDVMFGVNGEEKGVFFSGVAMNSTLWALVDVYGSTTALEFVDASRTQPQ